jgi:hypothetical protein
MDKSELPTETTTLRHYFWPSMPGEMVERAPSVQAFPEHIVGPKWQLYTPRINLAVNAFNAYAAQNLFMPVGVACQRGSEAGDERPRAIATWFLDVLGRLKELSGLPANWDHHGAPPVNASDLAAALKTLSGVMAADTPAPAIVPISGGGLQLEWHRAGLDVEVVVGLGEDDGLYFHEKSSDREWEGPTREGFAELNLAQRLIG